VFDLTPLQPIARWRLGILLISILLPGAAFICRMLLLEAASQMLFLP
jgi:hypothetical protein